MGYWAEIRNNYFESGSDVDRNLEGDVLATISIDAWKTMDDNEEGRVIARVLLSNHGDILVDYHDNVARVDTAAQEAIAEAKKELETYYRESVIGRAEKEPEPEQAVFCLCEEFEGKEGIREFQILAVSADKAALRQMMEAKINADEYDMIENNGIEVQEEDHFMTGGDWDSCGFVEYYISERKILSREEIGLLFMDEQPALSEQISNAEAARSSYSQVPENTAIDNQR